MRSIFAIKDSVSKFFANQLMETSNDFLAIFPQDESKMQKQKNQHYEAKLCTR